MPDDRDRLLYQRRIVVQKVRGLPGLVIPQTDQRIDGELEYFFWCSGSHLLDVHAARRTEHQHWALSHAVGHHAHIAFGGDFHPACYQHLLHGRSLDVHS